MALSGHSRELALPDLVQANALGRNTCRILVATSEGKGVIYLKDGAVVHASFGSLSGRDAFFALMAAENAFFQAESGILTVFQTVEGDWQGLMLEAMRLRDEGRLPRPRFTANAPGPAGPDGNIHPFPAPVAAVESARVKVPVRVRPRWPIAAAILLLAAVAVGGVLLWPASGDNRSTVAPLPAAALEATALTGPGDAQPRLVEGVGPRSPQPDLAVSPTIVCRLLVDERGAVTEAAIYRSRLDLAAFEEAALDAARRFRFEPAHKAGQPVAVWINWPVTFQ